MSLKKSSKKSKQKSKQIKKKNHKVFTGFDLFWNGPNVVLMAKMKYLVFSHLTAMVPIHTFVPVKQLSPLERDLIQLSFYIREYCSHQYTLHSILHNILDESIDSFRMTSHDSLLEEITNANAFLQTQLQKQKGGGGGNPLSLICKTWMLILFCQMSLSESSSFEKNTFEKTKIVSYPLQRDLQRDSPNAVITMNDMLDNMSYIETKSVKLPKSIQAKRISMLDYFQNLLVSTTPDTMTDIVSDFNVKAGAFSDEYSNICKQLMDETYENHIFKDWKMDEELNDLNAKIDEIIKTEDAEYIQRIAASVSASAVSFAAADYINAATYIGDVFFGKNTDKTSKLTKSEENNKNKQQMKDSDLNQVSKLFCTNSFQLFLNWEEESNELKLVADKINYEGLLKFIEQIQANIQIYEKLHVGSKDTDEKYLQSIRQRFAVMQKIVFKMQDLVHNDFHVSLTKTINRSGTTKDLNKYFSRQSHELHSFLELSQKNFPMDSLKLERNGKYLLEERAIKQNTAYLEDMKRQGVAQDIVDSLQSQWIATNTIMKSASNITSAFIKMSSKTIASGMLAFPEGIIQSFIDKIDDILRYSFLKPGFISACLCMLLVFLAICLGHPVVLVGKKIMKISFHGMTLVYKWIKTPFGYFLKIENTVVDVERKNSNHKTKKSINHAVDR